MPLQQFDERGLIQGQANFSSGYTPGTYQNPIASQLAEGRLDGIFASNSDTVAHELTVAISSAGPTNAIASVSVPAGAGHGAVSPVDVLGQLFGTSYHYLMLPAGFQLAVSLSTAPAASTAVIVHAFGGTY